MEEIGKVLEEWPGIQSEVVTFLGDRISETITGESAPVVLSVCGPDLDQIDGKAREVARALAQVRGAGDIKVKSLPGAPQLFIRLRPDRLQSLGYHPTQLLEDIRTAYQGEVVGQIHQGNEVADVTVILNENHRRDVESVGGLLVGNGQGLSVPLRELADVYLGSGRIGILHEAATRRQVITCHPEGGRFDTPAEPASGRRTLG